MADKKEEYWIEEQALASIDPSAVDKWGDPNKHPETQLTPAQQQALLSGGRVVFISHLTKEGFPMVTVHVYVVLDGVIWSTSVKGRVKAAAYKRDSRCALCISTSGVSGLDFGGGMTIKARAEVIEDRATVERICRAHGSRYYTSPKAQELFVASLFTPNRVALRFHVDKVVSWKNIGMRQS
jgi:general stress protein 26